MAKFNPSFFRNNRQKLLKAVKSPVIVVTANNQLQRNGDSSYPYRQDSNFWYLCGIEESGYTLVISSKSSYLIAPQLTRVQRVFDEQDEQHTIKKVSGVEHVINSKDGWATLKDQLKKARSVATARPNNVRHWGITPNSSRQQLIRRLQRIGKNIKIEDIQTVMAHLRMVKQPEELAAIQEAIDITSETLQSVFVRGWYNKFAYEYQLEAALIAGFRSRGAKGYAYEPIVASGVNACTLHYQDNNSKLKKGELLLIDVGAEVDNYASDISRVLPIGANFSRRQAEIAKAVIDAQKYALGLLQPGAGLKENEKKLETYIGQQLARLGIIKDITHKNIRRYYPHASSHMLGLDVHDAADYSMPLEPKMVLTVEPGIYIPEEDIGVRVEDDVVITKSGCRVLSHKLPGTLN